MIEIQEGKVVNNVLFGSGGHFFLHQGAHFQFDYLLGFKEPSKVSIDNFKNNIERRGVYLEEKGIAYRHVVFPSKPIIKAQYLPDDFKNVKSLFETYYSKSTLDDCRVLYPKEMLLELESNHVSCFSKLDTHNSDKGKEALVKFLLHSIGISNSHSYGYTEELMGGDLNDMLKSDYKSLEQVGTLCLGDSFVVDNSLYLVGNTNQVRIASRINSSSKKRLLIFGDSFFKFLIERFIPFFSDIMYVRSPYLHKEIVDGFAPDIVFTGNAERYLSSVSSDESASNFLMDLYGDKKYCPNDDYLHSFKAQLSYRYYPRKYKEWKEKYFSLLKEGDLLEVECWNEQLSLVENSDGWSGESLDIDPSIFFKDILFDDEKEYEFSIEFWSNEASGLQLYYTTRFDARFSANKSYAANVVAGYNHIKININEPALGRKLRLDPLNTKGRIHIYHMSLTEKNRN